jgi:DNA-binding Lrp family transcriptional regulator
MWEILEVLERHARGEPKTRIQKATGRSRRAVRRYIRLAQEAGWDPGRDPPSERLAVQVARQVRPGPRRPQKGEAWAVLERELEFIQSSLEKLTLRRTHRLLAGRGVEVAYSTLHRFAHERAGFGRKKVTVRMAPTDPGELAEVDYGFVGYLRDPETGQRRKLQALVVVLVHSRHMFVQVGHGQKVPDLIGGLEDAWEFFGGVPQRVVLDNLKAAVVKAHHQEPAFQRTFQEYARHRGFVIDPARPCKPKDKPFVERSVRYVKDSFFAGGEWRDLEEINRRAEKWCREIAGRRVHGTTRRRPLEVFLSTERETLQPLTKGRFDVPVWGRCKVHPDHHIRFGKADYSVPTRYIGKQVDVRKDSKLVRIYLAGEQIKMHPALEPGGRSTDYEDYPQALTELALRDPNRLITRGEAVGEHVGQFLHRLFSHSHPWIQIRKAQSLLRLAEKFPASAVDAACRRALRYEALKVPVVRRILEAGLEDEAEAPASAPITPLPLGRFQRPAGSFTHEKNEEERDDGNQGVA